MDTIGFQFLLQWHLVNNVSLVEYVMMVKAATLILHTLVEIFLAILTSICVVPLLKVVARSSFFGIKSRLELSLAS